MQIPQAAWFEAGDDQQDGIGAGQPGFGDLPFVEDEILADDGERHLCVDLPQVVEMAEEEPLVRQHAQAVRPAQLVLVGGEDRIVVLDEDALGRAALLALGDHMDGVGRRTAQGRTEAAGRRQGGEGGAIAEGKSNRGHEGSHA